MEYRHKVISGYRPPKVGPMKTPTCFNETTTRDRVSLLLFGDYNKEKRVRFCEETGIRDTVTPTLFRKSVSQQGWACTAWGNTVVTGRQRPNENTISSTGSVNVPESWGPTKHRQIHPSAVKDTNRFIVDRRFKCNFSLSTAAQQSFKCIWFCRFTVSYLV